MTESLLYEDRVLRIALPAKGLVQGHLVLRPASERQTVHELSGDEISYLLNASNFCAAMLFEVLGAHGTNIILNERPVRVDVVARKQDDNLPLLWTPKQLQPAEMTDAETKLHDAAFSIGKEMEKRETEKTPPATSPALMATTAALQTAPTTSYKGHAQPPAGDGEKGGEGRGEERIKSEVEDHEEAEDYLIRQLRRIP